MRRTATLSRAGRRLAGPGRIALLLAAAALASGPAARAADPQPYSVTIAPTGDGALDAALRDSSNLEKLRAAPAGPFALVTRAQEDRERLATALRSFGYYDGKVAIRVAGRDVDDPGLPDALDATPADPPVPVAVGVELGPRFRLRRIEVQGGPVPAAARAELKLEPGSPAVAADVLAAADRLLAALRRQGYALARVEKPDAVLDPAARALDVAFRAEPGPRVDLGPIAVQGLDRVHESYVRRRLLVQPGERFDPDRLERARQDLAAQGVFSTVRLRTAEQVDEDGRLPLIVEVTERPRRAVGFTAAYSTDLGASAGVTFQHRNLFGNAERLDLGASITQLGGSSTRGIGYDVPATLLIPDWRRRDQSLQFTLRAVKEDLEPYSRTAGLAGVTVSRKFWEYWTASVGVQAQQSQIEQERVTRDYTLVGLPFGVRYDSTGLEGLLEPTHGYKAAATITPTGNLSAREQRNTGQGGSSSSFVLLQLQGSTYINLAATPGRSILALRGTVGGAQGATTFGLPPDQRFYAGGSGTVRGYKYQSIGPSFPSGRPTGGTSMAAATVEYRQRIGESFGAVVFVDAGQVGTSSAPFTGDLRVGAGLGARYYTPIGPIRLDVAVPLNKQRRDDSFQLYIGIGQAF